MPFIVVFTKTDAPGAQIEKIKQQLAKEGVLLEGLGGDVPFIGVSAKTGDKIEELLELIVIVYDFSDIKKEASKDFLGVIVEAKLDKRRGILASLIVRDGKISVGDKVFTEKKEAGKIRALVDTFGVQVKEAYPGDAVEVLGFSDVLPAGSVVNTKAISTDQKEIVLATHNTTDLMNFLQNKQNEKLSVIIKTQTSGEFEAIVATLPEDVEVVYEARGEISASDVLMAKDFNAIVVGFNVTIEKQAKILADSNKIFYRTYNIIYNLLDELIDAIALIRERAMRKVLGKAQILATFEGNEGQILGVRITEGRLLVGDKIIISKGDTETPESKILSLKQGKKSLKELGKGNECGIMIDPQVDFTIGDMIISCI